MISHRCIVSACLHRNRYYWDDLPIYTQPTITKWGDRGFEEALEQAAEGVPQAIFRLSRVVRAAPDDPLSIRAAQVLEQVAAAGGSDREGAGAKL